MELPYCASHSNGAESAAVQQGNDLEPGVTGGTRGTNMGLNDNGLNGNGTLRLLDKVSIITGGGQGIGRATAIKFAKEGAKVAVCDINMSAVAETLAAIRAFGGEALGFQVDVTDKESIARMVEGIRKEELRKVPGVAETLDWAAALVGLDVGNLHDAPEAVHETMMCLLKTHEDKSRMTREVTARLLGKVA